MLLGLAQGRSGVAQRLDALRELGGQLVDGPRCQRGPSRLAHSRGGLPLAARAQLSHQPVPRDDELTRIEPVQVGNRLVNVDGVVIGSQGGLADVLHEPPGYKGSPDEEYGLRRHSPCKAARKWESDLAV